MARKRGKRTPPPDNNEQIDPRLKTPPGYFLRNAPWRHDVVEEGSPRLISSREAIVLSVLVVSSIIVAAALWISPPQVLRFKTQHAIEGQAVLAGHRVPRAYNGLGYDPTKFEEVKDDDPIVQDDLEDVLLEDTDTVKAVHHL
jgi:hypothetical protein